MYIFVLCISLQYPSRDWVYVQTAAIVIHNRVSIPKEPQTSREIRCDTCNAGQSIPLRSLSSRKEFITETRTRFLHLTSAQIRYVSIIQNYPADDFEFYLTVTYISNASNCDIHKNSSFLPFRINSRMNQYNLRKLYSIVYYHVLETTFCAIKF